MKGNLTLPGMLLLLVLVVPLAMPTTAQGDAVTRGGTFTVTVVGIPRTAYDIWVKGTHDMTGEPGDQPPVIVPGQVDVEQDPPGGPYPIGSTPVGGGGGTILDDVAPTSSAVPATSYYALVTTDIDGHGTVLFRTSADTATDRQFHIVARNPANPGEDVRIVLGVPPAPALPATTALTTRPTPAAPTAPAPVPFTTVPATPVPTTGLLAPALREEAPAGTTPVRDIPLPALIPLAAAGIGLLRASGRQGTG